MAIEEIGMLVADVADLRHTLDACINYFTANDVLRAQQAMSRVHKSPILAELERVKERLDGYFGDYLIEQYEQEQAPADEVPEPVEEEELNPYPLGQFKPPQQVGVPVDVLTQRDESLVRE